MKRHPLRMLPDGPTRATMLAVSPQPPPLRLAQRLLTGSCEMLTVLSILQNQKMHIRWLRSKKESSKPREMVRVYRSQPHQNDSMGSHDAAKGNAWATQVAVQNLSSTRRLRWQLDKAEFRESFLVSAHLCCVDGKVANCLERQCIISKYSGSGPCPIDSESCRFRQFGPLILKWETYLACHDCAILGVARVIDSYFHFSRLCDDLSSTHLICSARALMYSPIPIHSIHAPL